MRNDYPELARVGGPKPKGVRSESSLRASYWYRVLGFISVPPLVLAGTHGCQIRFSTLVDDSRCEHFTLQ